jgi:hypothetical protein
MYKTITKGTIEQNEENKNFYNRKGYNMTGETLTFTYEDNGTETEITYIVFKGSWTRSYSIRDCGKYYIHATGYQWNRINKDTLEVEYDIDEDK